MKRHALTCRFHLAISRTADTGIAAARATAKSASKSTPTRTSKGSGSAGPRSRIALSCRDPLLGVSRRAFTWYRRPSRSTAS